MPASGGSCCRRSAAPLFRIKSEANQKHLALRPSAVTTWTAAQSSAGPAVGLYDHSGMLRFSGSAEADCLAYAELFDLAAGSFSLAPLGPARPEPQPPAGCSS